MQWPRQQIVRRSFTLLLLAGTILGIPMPVKAADVGIFFNQPTSAITSPVNDKTYLLQNSVLYVYHGGSWVSLMPPLANLTAIVPPAITDDSSEGYGIGSEWVDTAGETIYLCEDATIGAAVWKQISDPLHFSDVLNKLTCSDAFSDWLVSGLLGAVPGSPSLAMTTPSGVGIVTGLRIVKGSYSFTYTVSKDTYEYLQNDGSILRVVLANGASAPTGQPGLPLQKVVTSGTAITAVTQIAPTAPGFASSASFQQAQILVSVAHPQLPNGRVPTAGTGISIDNSVPGECIIGLTGAVPSAGSGNIWGPGTQEFQDAPKLDTNTFKTAAGGTITIPETTDTMAGLNTAQNLTNKGLTSPQITDNTLKTALGVDVFLPEAGGDTLVCQATTDVLHHKTLLDPVFNGTPVYQNPIPKTTMDNAVRREVMTWQPGNSLALVPSTIYQQSICFPRAGTITKITVVATLPTAEINTAQLNLNAPGSSGNNLLNIGFFDLNSLTAEVGTDAGLTATTANLHLTAHQSIWCELTITTPSVNPEGLTVTIEFEPDSF